MEKLKNFIHEKCICTPEELKEIDDYILKMKRKVWALEQKNAQLQFKLEQYKRIWK